MESLNSDSNGAYVTFDGRVRNYSKGQEVSHLEFEAYEPMALKEMDKLILQALKQFNIHDARMIHRLGTLSIGESAVFIGVSASHRKDAFAACQFLIDRLKETVPIWKKEFTSDGEYWVSAHP